MIRQLKSGADPRFFPKLASFLRQERYGTVGAIAMDRDGKIAVAASTGGIMLHLPGRVGDTPIIGAGTYANQHGGVLATGHGEEIIKLNLAFRTAGFMEQLPAQKAVARSLDLASKCGCKGGLIAIDRRGNVGFGFNSQAMSYAYVAGGEVVVF